jgi:outer membrane protein insertion porin family
VSILLAALWSPAICAAQKPARLTKIEVVGSKRITPEQVIATSELQVGQTVDPGVLDAAAQKLLQSGLFKRLSYRVRGTKDQVTVTFEVEEAARNLPVVFENFVWFADDEIARAIRQDVPFFDGTAPEGGTTSNKIAAALQRLLDNKGIPGRVEFLPYADTATGKLELVFTAKGVKVPVCSLHLPGADAIPETTLIANSQQLIQSEYSKKDAAGFARYTLFPLYRRIGRLRAAFQDPSAKLDPETCAGGVAVTIPVEEGLAYSWDKAEWSGNQALTGDELSAALGMKTGELADGFKIDKGVKDVRKFYSRKGYIAMRSRESSEFDDANQRVTYRFAVQEGPQYHMGNLIINGLSPELSQNLKESWALASGAVFDQGYTDDFGLNALPRFIGTQMQRSPAFHARAELETKPDSQKLTVDVVITFK